jgi:aminoglycoside phosphotransferase (APT) family kinase protein
MRLWAERNWFLSALDHLPQTFSHLDFHRRNLLIRKRADNQEELVAVDWANCGIGPIGADLALAIGMSCIFFEWEPAAVRELEVATLEAYLAGLRDEGWDGDLRLARLGYLAWIALWLGVIMSGAIHAFTADETHAFAKHLIGHYGDGLASGWSTLCEFALDRADEARKLMDQLKLA